MHVSFAHLEPQEVQMELRYDPKANSGVTFNTFCINYAKFNPNWVENLGTDGIKEQWAQLKPVKVQKQS